MSLPGLVAANNLGDVINREAVWNNLGQNISATISGVPATITVKAVDILPLAGVRANSIADFVRIKGLTALAQPRLTTAASNAASSTVLRDNALLKNSPTSQGAYFIDRGNLDAQSLQVNGLNVASISGTPFSGDTAIAPLLISSFAMPINFRLSNAMPSGSLVAPERAIPVESSQFIFFAKAGQS